MKILIIGSAGMLGHALQNVFADAVGWDLPEIDITQRSDVMDKVGAMRPDILINAAAFTDVDGAEENEKLATKINGEAVGHLSDACLSAGTTMVHYSTDYVFDGEVKQGYREDDNPNNSINAYGRSKLAGEKELLNRMANGLQGYIIRTSWLFGSNGKNFVDTMVKFGREKEKLRVVDDQRGNPTYTVDLSLATKDLLEGEHKVGIYHVTNETNRDGITWFDFAREIVSFSEGSAEVEPCLSDEYPRPASRPQYSMLHNTKMGKLRDWKDALHEHLS